MAYKFQLGDARLSGSLIQEGDITAAGSVLPMVSAGDVALGSSTQEWADLFVRNNIKLGVNQEAQFIYHSSKVHVENAPLNIQLDLHVGDDIFMDSDSAAIHFGADSEVKLEHEHDDGVTLVSSVASKPVLRIKNTNDDANGAKLRIVKDTSNSAANNDVLGIIDFTGEDAGNAGHVYASMTAKSRVVTAGSEEGAIIFAVTDGGSDETNLLDINNTLDGGVTVANDLQVGDDIFMKSDSAAIHFGADSEVVLEHQHNDGLTLSSAVSDKPVLRMGNTNADATGPLLRFFKSPSDNSSANADVLGQIDFRGEDAGDSAHTYVRITAKSRDISSGAEHGALIFELGDGSGAGAGTGDPATLMDINSSLAKGVSIAHGLDVNGHDGSSEGLRLNGTLVTTTAAELNLLDGGTAVGSSITLADADGVIVDDAGTMKKIPASDFKSYLADNSLNVALKDNTNTLSNGVNYFADLSGAEAVSLPASPDVGDNVYIKAPSNCSSTNTLTINRQGSHTIDGQTSITLESPHAAVMLVYVVANTWKVF